MKTVSTTANGTPATLDSDTGELTPIDDRYNDVLAQHFWKTPYNHNTNKEADRTALYCLDESKTQQHFKDEQDINKIVERVLRTGVAPDIPTPLQYADLTTMDDYHTMQNKLAETKGLFYRLPPTTRAEYGNDPGAWLEDVNDKMNNGDVEPLRKMGLDLSKYDAEIERQAAEARKQADAEADARAEARAAAKGATAPKT